MTPFIAKLIERSCVTTHADCPLNDLIEILAERRIGTVVVVDRDQIGRAHVRTPVTRGSRMPSSA